MKTILTVIIIMFLMFALLSPGFAATTHHKQFKYQPTHKPNLTTWHHPPPRIYITPGISKTPPQNHTEVNKPCTGQQKS